MQRPDLATLACVNVECQYFGRPHQGNLAIRKVYGQDRIRLLRCGQCREEFSEHRNTALFNTKVSEAKAEEVIDHLDEGCSVRSTSRLTKVEKETVARLLKAFGRRYAAPQNGVKRSTESRYYSLASRLSLWVRTRFPYELR